MKKVFLFDLDGVIIKTRFFSEKYEADFWVSKEIISQFLKENLPTAQLWKADLKEIIENQREKLQWKKSAEDFLTYWFEYDSIIDSILMEHIQHLRGKWYHCFLLTNQEKYRYVYITETLKIWDKFDEIFSSHMIWFSKSQAEYFIQVLKILKEKYNIKESDCIFFDDKESFVNSAKQSWIEGRIYTDIDSFLDYQNTLT